MIRFAMSSTSTPADALNGRVSRMHSCATSPSGPAVQHRVVRLEPLGDVVRVEDRDLGRLGQPVAAHHRDVRPRDRQDRCASPRRRRHRAAGLRVIPGRTTGCPGRNGARCFATPIGPMPGPPPPCGMQNVLCRFRWQTSAPMSPGPAQPDLRVHVRAVHVHLAAVLVHDPADLADRSLEHAVRRRIRHHQRRQRVAVLRRLRPQVGDVDVALVVALHRRRPACPPSPRSPDWCRAPTAE